MIDFADLCRPQPGRVTRVVCYRCQTELRYRPADGTYFATAEDATLSSAEDENRPPIRSCPTRGRELYRRNNSH